MTATAPAAARSTTAGSGAYPDGAPMRTDMPAIAPPTSSECAMLLAPSPR